MVNTLSRNIKIFYASSFLGSLSFTTAIWTFFFTSFHSFSYSQAFTISLLPMIISLFFEIHSGSWADRYGRKKLLILGNLLIAIDIIIWTFAKDFWVFIASGILLGIGYAITSGNFSAIIHDELESEGKSKSFKNISANSHVSLFLARAFSGALTGFLYVIHPLIPIILTALIIIINFFLTFFIKQSQQSLSNDKGDSEQIISTIKDIYNNKTLLFIILISISICGLTNIFWFTYQPLFLSLNLPIEYIGIIFGTIALLSAFGSYIIKVLQDKYSRLFIIKLSLIIISICSLFLSSFNTYLVGAGVVFLSIQMGTLMPFTNNALLEEVDKNKKSTTLSIFGFGVTISFSILALTSGYLLDIIGIEMLYHITTIILIVFTLFVVVLKKELSK